MADAQARNHALSACGSAIRNALKMPPSARLWLARASLFTDARGRTMYSPERYANDMQDTADNARNGIEWLLENALVMHDHNDDGIECWRLAHYDWDGEKVITGYGRDAGQKRDGLPPQYGRTVADVIEPPSGRQDFTAPKWNEIKGFVLHQEEPTEEDW